jgi:hypothetical protein
MGVRSPAGQASHSGDQRQIYVPLGPGPTRLRPEMSGRGPIGLIILATLR